MQPQKKTQASDIISRLNMMLANGEEPNAFFMTRAEQQARSLMGNDATTAHLLLGMIACVHKNNERMRAHHENAIQLSASNPEVYAQYAVSLSNLGYYSEANGYFEKAKRLGDTNILNEMSYVRSLIASGRIEEGFARLDELDEDAKKSDYMSRIKNIRLIDSVLSKHGVTDREIEQIQIVAMSLVHKHGLKFDHITVRLDEGADESVTFEISLKEPADRIVELNFELINELISQNIEEPEVITVQFLPAA